MIHAGRKRRANGPGYPGWGPAHCFFLFLFLFPFCSSSPMGASTDWDGVESFALCAPIPFLFFALLMSFLLLSFLGVDARDLGYSIINK